MPIAPDPVPFPLDHLVVRGKDEATALILRDRRFSYRELRARVACLAAELPEGARVASWAAKGETTCLLPLAAARAGLVHVPINPLLKRAQISHILADSGADMLIGTRARLGTLEAGDAPSACRLLDEEECWHEAEGLGGDLGPSSRIGWPT